VQLGVGEEEASQNASETTAHGVAASRNASPLVFLVMLNAAFLGKLYAVFFGDIPGGSDDISAYLVDVRVHAVVFARACCEERGGCQCAGPWKGVLGRGRIGK